MIAEIKKAIASPKVDAVVAAITGVLLSPAKAFATTYTMDTGVSTAAGDLITSLSTTLLGQIVVAVGLIGGIFVTMRGLRWLFGFAFSHMK